MDNPTMHVCEDEDCVCVYHESVVSRVCPQQSVGIHHPLFAGKQNMLLRNFTILNRN